MIYLDYAATSFHKPKAVAEAVYQALQHTGNSGRGVHGAALDASRLVYETREKISDLFHVGDASRVIFTANATESLNIVIQGLLGAGDHCITSNIEHNSVLRPLCMMASRGVEVSYVEADESGTLSPQIIEQAITSKTKAVVLTHASNVLGSVNDLKAIGAICKKQGVLLIVDASQTAGLIAIDLQAMQIDALCCSGHKSLLGPQGVGLLCLNKGVMPKPLKAGGTGTDSFSQTMDLGLPTALEAGTLNTHGIIGLNAACDYLKDYTIEKLFNEATARAKQFIEGLKELEGISFYGELMSSDRTPVVALNIRNFDAAEVADELFERFGIATRAGAHCAPKVHEAYGTIEQGMVRFSFSHFNTEEEVAQAIQAVRILEEETR